MRKIILCVVGIIALGFWGCASEQSTKDVTSDTNVIPVLPTPKQQAPFFSSTPQPIADEVFVSNDSLITYQLEQARQHYLAALNAQDQNDLAGTTQQFEQAIQILDDLSYYPEIDANQDFNDLSKTIVEDYERYIRKTGSIDSTSSIFALREKLSLISEQADTGKESIQPKTIVTGTTIPLVINNLVDKHIGFFTGRGRHHMENYLRRSGKYFPMMKKIMREEGVPEEIVYLSMVESGLNPIARSWAKAVGIWQFIKGTGSMYGLKSNFWYDDRRDFEKATRAAARHLRDLYEDFEDWYLVMAAYNSGAGNVYRGMRRSGSNDFWEMRNHLPRETRNYVPSYIAVAVIGLNPSEYGFNDIELADSLDYDYVTVNECVDLDLLAECAGTDAETLRDLNPALLHRCTPPASDGFQLRVPGNTNKEAFAAKYAEIPEGQKGYLLTHAVRRGDTLPKLARRYGLSTSVLAEANNLNTKSKLRKGSSLLIPLARNGSQSKSMAIRISNEELSPKTFSAATNRSQARVIKAVSNTADRTKIAYKVKSGDTISNIAEWFSVRSTDVRNWNNLPYGRKIIVGTTLNIWVARDKAEEFRQFNGLSAAEKSQRTKKPAVVASTESSDEAFHYVVKSGDILEKIAQEHGVTVRQIQRWNNLRSTRISTGKRLTLYPQVATVSSRGARTAAVAKATSQGKSQQIIYVVRRGDTISGIAQTHDVREAELRAWNSLNRKSRIYAGQELVIRKETN